MHPENAKPGPPGVRQAAGLGFARLLPGEYDANTYPCAEETPGMDHAEIGRLFSENRRALKLTQLQVATHANAAVSTVCRLETGALLPSAEKIAAIAQVCKVTPEQLGKLGLERPAKLLELRLSMHADTVLPAASCAGLPSGPEDALVKAVWVLLNAGWSIRWERAAPGVIRFTLSFPGWDGSTTR